MSMVVVEHKAAIGLEIGDSCANPRPQVLQQGPAKRETRIKPEVVTLSRLSESPLLNSQRNDRAAGERSAAMVTKEKLRSGVDCDALGYKLVSRSCRTVSIHFVA
jgi:hypothetical protein